MLVKSNTVFMLEPLLRRHVYGRPLELKREAAFGTRCSLSWSAL
jgi:hypothetical protein